MNTPSAKHQQPSRAKPAATPITAHRLFPAIVALWFAALLGIGSLVVPPEKLSAVVSALGIPKLVHAAAPPLGFTARALLALAMAGLGVIVGLVIGSRIAARHTVQPQRKTDPTRGRQEQPARTYSYNPAEQSVDQGDEALPDVVPAVAAPRRPLHASEAFADIEPLTETAETVRQANHNDAALPSDDHFAVLGPPKAERFEPADEILNVSFDALLLNPVQPEPIAQFAPPAPFTTLAEQDEPPAFELARKGRFTRDLAEMRGVQPDHELAGAPSSASQTAPAHAPAHAAPAFTTPAFTTRAFTEPACTEIAAIEAAVQRLPAAPDVRRTLGEAPLESLGTVQLVERLALAMATATEARSAPTHLEAPLELDTIADDAPHHEFTPSFVASVAEAEAEPVADLVIQASETWSAPDFAEHASICAPDAWPDPTTTRGSIIDPIGQVWDDESDEDEDTPTIAPPRFLSARATAGEQPQHAADHVPLSATSRPLFGGRQSAPAAAKRNEDPADARDDGGAAGEDRYPSLLDIQPIPREAIRIPAPDAQQAEPIVMFPNATARADAPFAPPPASALQSRRSPQFRAPGGKMAGTPVTPPELPADPVDSQEADRALRAALATLQRMSGGR